MCATSKCSLTAIIHTAMVPILPGLVRRIIPIMATPEQIASWISSLSPDAIIAQWKQSKINLADATLIEAALRERAIQLTFPTQFADKSSEGTHNADVGNGWKAKAVFGQNYKLPAFEKVKETMTAIRNLGTVEAGDAFRNLIKYSPELSISAYRKVTGDVKKYIDAIITTTPKRTTFELIPPQE